MSIQEKVKQIYQNYETFPYISPDRDLEEWLRKGNPVPKRNMENLGQDLLAGDIILLWRVSFDTFHNQSIFPKYFEYSYGIEAKGHLDKLLEKGYVLEESALDSLDLLSAKEKKEILKELGLKGLSKMKVADLDQALKKELDEEQLSQTFSIRSYKLTEKGAEVLAQNQAVVDRHPQKKF